jgi:hypothetical protein
MDKNGKLNATEQALLRDLQRQAETIGHVVVANSDYGRLEQRVRDAGMLASSLRRGPFLEHPAKA